jgi:parallel beta-helix repeat protein
MKGKTVLVVFISMLLLHIAICIGTPKVEAGSTTIVCVNPDISYGALAETFAVNVTIANVADFVAFEYKLRWNSTLLRCITYEKCDPAVDLGWSIYYTVRDDFTADRHWLAVDGARELNPFVGNATLATYTFQVIGFGECVVDLYDVTLVNSNVQTIEDWSHKDSLDDCCFEFRTFEHDLAVFLDSPTTIIPGDSVLLNTTVFNDGLNDETGVELLLLINGSIVNSTVISFLQVDSSCALSYLWTTSTDEAVYNVTTYVLPVPDEGLTINNIESTGVSVSYAIKIPLHYPTIQEAIYAASPGDAILVSTGTYYEHLIIDKSLTLVGEESNIPTINGNGSHYCITVTADNVNINGFIIESGIYGIEVRGCNFATIIGNTILNNDAGIALFGDSHSNTIIGNTLLDNYVGILLLDSHNNTVYHNNFINSTKFQFGGDNLYNDLEGNYWSDYKGVDEDGDGVGDTAHVINENNQDEHPFTVPLDPVPIIWGGAIYPVELSSNSTVFEIDFRPLQRSMSFNVTGLDGTIGFCNVTIPNSLLEDLWQGNCMVFVDGKQPLTITNWTDGTFTYIYFTYHQSQHEVTIVPEFHPFLILPLFMIATLLAVLAYKRKHSSGKGYS